MFEVMAVELMEVVNEVEVVVMGMILRCFGGVGVDDSDSDGGSGDGDGGAWRCREKWRVAKGLVSYSAHHSGCLSSSSS